MIKILYIINLVNHYEILHFLTQQAKEEAKFPSLRECDHAVPSDGPQCTAASAR